MKRLFTAIVTWNACAWPYVFTAYAIWSGDHYRVLGYVAAGAVFGGIVLLTHAALLVVLATWFPESRFAKRVVEASLPARKIAGGALIVMAIGAAGLALESFRYKPAFERSGDVAVERATPQSNGRVSKRPTGSSSLFRAAQFIACDPT